MKNVSVIVPIHNNASTLIDCLMSIETQSLRDIEIICIDDASKDDSLRICEMCAKDDERYVIHAFADNKGASIARNYALEQAQGEYVIFVDSDDELYDAYALESLYTAATQHDFPVVAGEMCVVDKATGKARLNFKGAGHTEQYNFDHEGPIDYRIWQGDLGFQRFMFKREFLFEHNLFFPDYARYEDPVFLVRTLLAAGSFWAIKQPVYRYYFDEYDQSFSTRMIDDAIDAHLDLLYLAREEGLIQLRSWLIESLRWYLAYDVYRSFTYRLGDKLARPYRRIAGALSSFRNR